MISLVLAVLFFCAFLYKLVGVWRTPRNLGAWAVLTLLAALTIVSLVRDNVPGVFGQYAVENVGVLVRNVALLLGFGGLQLWHLHHCRIPARRGRVEAVILAGAVVALCLIAALIPDGISLASPDSGASPTSADLQSGWVQLFYRVAGIYTWYALGCQFVWNLRAARVFRQRWLRVSALLTAAGDFFLIFAQLCRAAGQTAVYLTGQNTPPAAVHGELIFIILGMPPLLVGLLCPPIVGAVRHLATGLRQLRRYRELRALHDAIRWAYPGMIRPHAPGGAATAPRLPRTPRQLRDACEERVQQCRDGYARTRGEPGGGRPDTRPHRLARTIRELRANADLTDDPADLADEHREIRHLIALSRALREHGDWTRTAEHAATRTE